MVRGHAQIKDMILRSPQLDSDMKSLVATVRTIPSKDTTRMAQVECKMEMHKLKVALGDSLGLFCGKSSATLKVQPGEHNPSKPQIELVMETDTLFCRMGGVKAGMNKAGIGITAEKYVIHCGCPMASWGLIIWLSVFRNVHFPYICKKPL